MPSYFSVASAFTNIADAAAGTTDTYATAQDSDGPTVAPAGFTDTGFRLTAFGFAIPLTETVVGIEIRVLVGTVVGIGVPSASLTAAPYVGGSAGTRNQVANANTTPYTEVILGGPNNLLGTTPTASQINLSGFGVEFRSLAIGGFATPNNYEVDLLQVTIYTADTPYLGNNVPLPPYAFR